MNEVRLTLDSFLSLCKLFTEINEEKERLRKIVVMQNDALEKLSSTAAVEKRWIKEYYKFQRRRIEASTADLDMRDKHESEFWPPLGMIP